MSHENPEQPRHSLIERLLPLTLQRKLGNVAVVGLLMNPLGVLANRTEAEPVTPVNTTPAAVLSVEMPGSVLTNEVPNPVGNHEQQQDRFDPSGELHIEAGDPDKARDVSHMFTQDKDYGVLGKNPGDDGAAPQPLTPHASYGPVNVEQLQLVVPAGAERRA